MPNWQPNWTDVRFDHAAATDAAAELRATARRLSELLGTRARARAFDLVSWVGPARDVWDERFAASQREGHALAERLVREAARIEAAAEDARIEQQRRERDRERWRRERAAEERAAREAAAREPAASGGSSRSRRGGW